MKCIDLLRVDIRPWYLSFLVIVILSASSSACRSIAPVSVSDNHPANPEFPVGDLSVSRVLDEAYLFPAESVDGIETGVSHAGHMMAEEREPENSGLADTAHFLPAEATAVLDGMLQVHDTIRVLIRGDRLKEAAEQARRLSHAVTLLKNVEVSASPHFWHQKEALLAAVTTTADKLGRSTQLEEGWVLAGELDDAMTHMFEVLRVAKKSEVNAGQTQRPHNHGGH
ncbi:MAG: hypothetical protein AAF564_15770 [Bacteroidota bacterium]